MKLFTKYYILLPLTRNEIAQLTLKIKRLHDKNFISKLIGSHTQDLPNIQSEFETDFEFAHVGFTELNIYKKNIPE